VGDLALRIAGDADRQFIVSTAVRQARVNPFFAGVSTDVLGSAVREAVICAFASPDWTVAVVEPETDPGDEICGWIIYRDNVVLMAYVKRAYRGLGAFRLMRNHALPPDREWTGAVLADPHAIAMARRSGYVHHMPFLLLELANA
jgi:hypothetical protein